jgi:hypothetical protein
MTTCHCLSPPGGSGSCGSNQLAFCDISNGPCQVSCVDVSPQLISLIQSRGRSDPYVLEQLVVLVGSPADVPRLADPLFVANFVGGIYLDANGIATARYELPLTASGGTSVLVNSA